MPWRVIRQRGMGCSPDLEHPGVDRLEEHIPKTITYYDVSSCVFPRVSACHKRSQESRANARAEHHPDSPLPLDHQNGSLEGLISRRTIPISAPHEADSSGLRFVSEVMERITKGYADALVAARRGPLDMAESFKAELSERSGIVCVYQTRRCPQKDRSA